jgi:hypothetical protein
MEIYDSYQNVSNIYQELAQKQSQLAQIDKDELSKSTFERNDSVLLSDGNYDENDYQRVLDRFQNRDQEVKTHEQVHASSTTTTSAMNYNYQLGPDGKLYAMGGSVRFDTSIPQDKEAASSKLEELKKAANAPGSLSSADAQIAQTANLNKMLIDSLREGFSYDY